MLNLGLYIHPQPSLASLKALYGDDIQKIDRVFLEIDSVRQVRSKWPGLAPGLYDPFPRLKTFFPLLEDLAEGKYEPTFALTYLDELKNKLPRYLNEQAKRKLKVYIRFSMQSKSKADQRFGSFAHYAKKILSLIAPVDPKPYHDAASALDHVLEGWERDFVPVLDGVIRDCAHEKGRRELTETHMPFRDEGEVYWRQTNYPQPRPK